MNGIWLLKKESANEGRIRLAIDAAAAGIGTVKNVRGTGLSSYDEDGEDLKVRDDRWSRMVCRKSLFKRSRNRHIDF